MRTVLITGASSGIGYEFAKIFAKNGDNIVITARRKENLDKIKEELSQFNVKIDTVVLDLSQKDGAKNLYNEIKSRGIVVDTLINNAGIGVYGKYIDTDMDKEIQLVDLNVNSLLILTKLFLKDMVANNKGDILNVASIASFLPGPLMSVYYASKAFVLSFSESIRNEVSDTNVNISVLCPGPTSSEFEKSANSEDSALFSKSKVMTPLQVAEIGYKGLQKKKAIIITGGTNRLIVFLNKLTPRSIMAKIVRKLQEAKN
mgnify:CR=1 FL=1